MKNINAKYKYPESYNPRYINGALGGINMLGEIIINFYLERTPIPKQQTFEVSDNGQIQKLISNDPADLDSSSIRFVESGIIMTPDIAKEIHKWLGEQITHFDRLAEQKKRTQN